MQPSRHWLIGSALGCLLAATLAVLTDAALPPAAPLPLPPVTSGVLPPFGTLGHGTEALQSQVDALANRPSVDAALDREMRQALLADVQQRLQRVRDTSGEAAEIAQLERMAERLTRLP